MNSNGLQIFKINFPKEKVLVLVNFPKEKVFILVNFPKEKVLILVNFPKENSWIWSILLREKDSVAKRHRPQGVTIRNHGSAT